VALTESTTCMACCVNQLCSKITYTSKLATEELKNVNRVYKKLSIQKKKNKKSHLNTFDELTL